MTNDQEMKTRLRSFLHAGNGLVHMLRSEANARIHLIATCLVMIMGLSLGLSAREWIWIASAVCLVFSAELFNSAIEGLCDTIQPEFDSRIKLIKDMSAGAVLMISLLALLIGSFIFIPRVADWI